MLRDTEAFPMAERIYDAPPDDPVGEAQRVYVNDDFDDVFGSAPSSPRLNANPDSDENGDNTSRRNGMGIVREGGNAEVSDIPRLKEKHETEGYRDGVTKGKAEMVQVGFDEGYGLGAVLGLKIGWVLGILEGIFGALSTAEEGEKERVDVLLRLARKELATESVFGREWWGEDGIWKFDVPGDGEGEVVFQDVAGAHPLVEKWEGIIKEEVRRWGVDLSLMEGDHSHVQAEKTEDIQEKEILATPMRPGTQKVELSW